MDEEEILKLDEKLDINKFALEMYRKTRIRWEEMNVENAKTEVLIAARDMIQDELDKRLR